MHENLVAALYSLVYLHRWSKVVFISAFNIVTGLFDWLWCVFMVFNVILLLFVNHLKDFFCDLQTAWRLVLSMKPWSYIWLEIGLFSTIIYIYIYIYIRIPLGVHGHCGFPEVCVYVRILLQFIMTMNFTSQASRLKMNDVTKIF